MLKFINTTPDGVHQKRKQTAQACDTCRRRKKRCSHLGKRPTSPASETNSPRNGGRSLQNRQPFTPSVSVGEEDFETTAETLPNPSSHAWSGRDQVATSGETPTSHTRHACTPTNGSQESRFVGDLNPEGTFLADSPGTNCGYAEPDGVGVWFSSASGPRPIEARRSGRTGRERSESVLHSSGLFFPAHVEEQCLSMLPEKGHYEMLKKIYQRDVHRILPVLDMALLDLPDAPDSPAQILTKQAICLAAGATPLASPFLTLGAASPRPLGQPEFSRRLSGAMRTLVSLGVVRDRMHIIPVLVILSLYTHFSEDRHVSTELAAQAVSYAQTIGLHLQTPAARCGNASYRARLFCCVWAVDRLNAAFHGRPVMMHERDFGRDLPACISQQESCFRLFLQTISLLDTVIGLYRPGSEAVEKSSLASCFPSFEQLVEGAEALSLESRLTGTIEMLYHAIAILSCRMPHLLLPDHTLPHSSITNSRQSLSAIRITTIMDDFGSRIPYLPFVPYALSLSLRVSYRELRSSKVALLRARFQRQLQATCRILQPLCHMFHSAHVMVDLAEQFLQEINKVCLTTMQHPEEVHRPPVSDIANSLPAGGNTVATHATRYPANRPWEPDTLCGGPTEPYTNGILTSTTNVSSSDELLGINIFEHFDTGFDLDTIDTVLGAMDPTAMFNLTHTTMP